MKLNLLVLFLLLIYVTMDAQEINITKIYSDDFDAFIGLLEQTHPDPYSAYGGRVEFNRTVQLYRKEVSKISDQEKLYNLLCRFLSTLKDGHTTLNNPKSNSAIDTRHFPIKFKIVTDGMFVAKTTSEYGKYVGCRLTAVNNIPIDSLLIMVGQIKASENLYGTYSNLAAFLGNNNSAALLFSNKTNGLKLTLKNQDNNSINIEIPFIDKAEIIAQKSNLKISKPNGLLYWDMLDAEKNVGYFAWNSTVSRELAEQIMRDAPQYIEPNLNWIYQALPEVKRSENNEEAIKYIPSLYEQFSALLEEMKT